MPDHRHMVMDARQRTSDEKLAGVLSSLTQSVRIERFVLYPYSLSNQHLNFYFQYGILHKLIFSLNPTSPEIVSRIEVRVKRGTDGMMFMEAPLGIGSDLDLWIPIESNMGLIVEMRSQVHENIEVQMSIFDYMCDLNVANRYVNSTPELVEVLNRVRFAGPRGQSQISPESLEQLMAMQRRTAESVEFLGAHVQNMSDAIRKHLHEEHGKPLTSQPPIGRTGNRVVS